jgi:hypothetical protein
VTFSLSGPTENVALDEYLLQCATTGSPLYDYQVFILDIYYRRESGVSQASRRVAQRIEKDKKLKKKIDNIEKKLHV